ncbi:hypothetical protein BVX97_02505 [bacterium E08(2017)]|nr:hypothetical protein BVX97_02505 [bacterium E08(2017)]
MKDIPFNLRNNAIICACIFVVMLVVYSISIPGSFNTVSENRKYFDSDGEFITRQFRQGKIFTHNDHLLYHILGKAIYDSSDKLQANEDSVTPHKSLSVYFGALGVTFFYLFGSLITRKPLISILCALFSGGTAGYWFFSATIDTYVPCLSVSIPVLGLAVLALKGDARNKSIAIGALAGLAFLFRTDSFLLALMGCYLLRNNKKFLINAGCALAAGVAVGLLGYAILSAACYDISMTPSAMWDWMSGSMTRPETAKQIWGQPENITPYNAALMTVNQLFYTIVIPGLLKTRGADFYVRYSKGGWIPFIIWLAAFAVAIFYIVKALRKKDASSIIDLPFAMILAGIWFLSRLFFYTWWDPFDPFLFAGMAMPAIWLVVLLGFNAALSEELPLKQRIFNFSLLSLLTLAVWLHNWYYIVIPLGKS